MTPDRLKLCRKGLGLSQSRFGELVGVSRMSINHYERGERHDDRRPVEIPRTVEMACAAIWLGVRDFQDLGLEPTGGTEARIRADEIPTERVQSGRKKLIGDGFDLSEFCYGFTIITLVKRWNDILGWSKASGFDEPKLHFVCNEESQFFAIVDFETSGHQFYFKMKWH